MITQIQYQIPIPGIQFAFTAQHKKILAVALASIALFVFQLGFSLPIACGISLFTSALTWLSEKYLRTEKNDWFNTDFDKQRLAFWATLILLKFLIIYIFYWSLGVPFPIMPPSDFAKTVLANPWRMISLAAIVAPVAEEILFRGFFIERLEDIGLLLNRHTFIQLGKRTTDFCIDVIQALVFGAAHLKNILAPSFMGYVFSLWKRKQNTLIAPMVIHSAHNISVLFHCFTSAQ
ncbi:MAG: CPBP family intramembrane glutamic endopeptidase [Chlamydiales bacterium]